MLSLKECLIEADKKGVAIGHFNFSHLAGLWGIVRAAQDVGVPVILGTSEGERNFVGVRQAAALVQSVRDEYNIPVFLNADHTYSITGVDEAARAGYDAVIFDGASLPFEENQAQTKEAARVARSANPHIIVEGEMGYIGTSSSLLEELPEGASVNEDSFTDPEEAAAFVRETGVDLFAPAVGNVHGMLKNAKNPRLSIDRIRAIRAATGIPLVLHGGSGITDDDFVAAINAGVRVVHINTEIRVAFRRSLEEALARDPEQIAPYKIMAGAVDEVRKVVAARLRLFSGISS